MFGGGGGGNFSKLNDLTEDIRIRWGGEKKNKMNTTTELSRKLTLVNCQLRVKFVAFWNILRVIYFRRQKHLFQRFWMNPLNKKQTSAVDF